MTAMVDEDLFVIVQGMERCRICGARATGFGAPDAWKEKCRRGHKPCPVCGRLLGLRVDGSARSHPRCARARVPGVRCASCREDRIIQEMAGNACIFCWREHGEEWLSKDVKWLKPLTVRQIRAAMPK